MKHSQAISSDRDLFEARTVSGWAGEMYQMPGELIPKIRQLVPLEVDSDTWENLTQEFNSILCDYDFYLQQQSKQEFDSNFRGNMSKEIARIQTSLVKLATYIFESHKFLSKQQWSGDGVNEQLLATTFSEGPIITLNDILLGQMTIVLRDREVQKNVKTRNQAEKFERKVLRCENSWICASSETKHFIKRWFISEGRKGLPLASDNWLTSHSILISFANELQTILKVFKPSNGRNIQYESLIVERLLGSFWGNTREIPTRNYHKESKKLLVAQKEGGYFLEIIQLLFNDVRTHNGLPLEAAQSPYSGHVKAALKKLQQNISS